MYCSFDSRIPASVSVCTAPSTPRLWIPLHTVSARFEFGGFGILTSSCRLVIAAQFGQQVRDSNVQYLEHLPRSACGCYARGHNAFE
jgi:hypothetical protein